MLARWGWGGRGAGLNGALGVRAESVFGVLMPMVARGERDRWKVGDQG